MIELTIKISDRGENVAVLFPASTTVLPHEANFRESYVLGYLVGTLMLLKESTLIPVELSFEKGKP